MKYLIITLIFLSGCKIFQPTEWQSQKRINKVEHFHPYLLSKYCAETFPVKSDTVTREYYKKGDTVQKYITIDCDTARITNTVTKERLVNVPCDCRVDTIFRDRIVTTENTAALSEEKAKTVTVTDDRDKKAGIIKTLTWVVIIEFVLIVLMIIGAVLLWKFKLSKIITK